jgi:DNA replication protein DnaC
MHPDTLLPLLKTLHFNGMIAQFNELIEIATSKKMTGTQMMHRFLETEIAYRQTRSLRYRLDLARLPHLKSLDQFDCQDTPLQPDKLGELAECQFIADKRNVLLIGGTGSGKTHLALSLAYAALQKRYRSRFYLLGDLARHLLEAKEHRYEANFIARLQRFHLLVIDEFGYFPIDNKAEALLFELFSKLYEKTSLIIATHLTFDEWTPLFGSPKACKAIIDRITHRCHIVETGNVSWRLKEGNMVKK